MLRLRWLGHKCGKERDTCRKVTFHKPDGIRRVGRPARGWLGSGEEGLKYWALEIAGEFW